MPAPISHVVAWNNQEMGVYLRSTPGGEILAAVPNGGEITQYGESKTYGGLNWVQARYDGQEGWVTDEYLFEMVGEYQQAGEDGDWLFKDVDGIVILYLWEGTPYQVVGEQTKGDWGWTQVKRLGGSTSWLKDARLGK